jgi:hypothetical protein
MGIGRGSDLIKVPWEMSGSSYRSDTVSETLTMMERELKHTFILLPLARRLVCFQAVLKSIIDVNL